MYSKKNKEGIFFVNTSQEQKHFVRSAFVLVFVPQGTTSFDRRSTSFRAKRDHHCPLAAQNEVMANAINDVMLRINDFTPCGVNDVALRTNLWYNLYHKRGDSNERR